MNFRVYKLYLNNNFKKSKPGPCKKNVSTVKAKKKEKIIEWYFQTIKGK